jgi:hypothetical protein
VFDICEQTRQSQEYDTNDRSIIKTRTLVKGQICVIFHFGFHSWICRLVPQHHTLPDVLRVMLLLAFSEYRKLK